MSNKVSPEDEKISAGPNEEEKVDEEPKRPSIDLNKQVKKSSIDSSSTEKLSHVAQRTSLEVGETQGEKLQARNADRTQETKDYSEKPRRKPKAEKPKQEITAEEKKAQMDLLKKEEELMKKIAYHQHDKANVMDSEESIFIAAPPPENRMSVVQLVICGVKGYKKCLYVCAALQFMTAAAVCASVLLVREFWPTEFSVEFRIESEWTFLKSKVFIFISAIWPLVIFVWFLFTVIFSTTKKVCGCCPQKTHWCIRGYYVYSSFFLLLPFVNLLTNILMVGNLSPEKMERVMFKYVNLYDSDKHFRKSWDRVQNSFHCCGVGEQGWKDWEHRMKVEEEVVDWIVPASCCRKQSPKEISKCQNETTDDIVWENGCLDYVYNMCLVFGNLFICTLAANMLMNFVTICFSTRLYSALRSGDGSPVEFNMATYLMECCCCCRKCKPP